MNEQELKEIWKSVDEEDLPIINFEEIQKEFVGWQSKLQRKIKIDIFLNVLFYIVLIPVFIAFPKLIYLFPVIALVWIWYLWELLRIYRQEKLSSGLEYTKLYLEKKKTYLVNYIFRTRLFLYISTPFMVIATLYVNGDLKLFRENPGYTFILLILLEISIIIMTEIYVRMVYSPSIKNLKNLLKQLESE